MSHEAIIMIPGITGSQLIDVNTHNFHPVWRDIRYNFQKVEDLELTDEFQGEFYEENINTLIERGAAESLAYKEFMDDLETDVPKFYFSYDWRRSNRENGRKLNDFVEMLKQKSQASTTANTIEKISIITHSMGNHICRFYIRDFGFASIDKIVFVAPPFKGSLATVDTLLRGQGYFKNIKKKLREVMRTFPGALELLPNYENAALFTDDTPVDFFNKDHWQKNLTASLGSANAYAHRLAEKFINNLNRAKEDLKELDQWIENITAEEKERILVVVRDEFKSFQAVRVHENQENFIDLKNSVKTESGDGVVPHISSCCYLDEIRTLAIEDSLWYDDDSHAFVMTEERVQNLASWFLDSSRPFDPKIPGGSIKEVSGFKKVRDGETGLWHYQITKKDV
ncbi:MAG: hypothetical protein ABJP45_02935 [Cyclobacteriaceae bacterium]